MNKIIDCFLFNNELNMLNFRFKELNDVIDYFVLCEARYTFGLNEKKELFYDNNKYLFEEYKHKIVHLIIDEFPVTANDELAYAWDREYFQRKYILKGLESLNLNDDDNVIISDCDEIPNSELLSEIKKYGFNIFKEEKNKKFMYLDNNLDDAKIVGLRQDLYYYNLESKKSATWAWSKIAKWDFLKKHDPQQIRWYACHPYWYGNAGWHFSYFGDANFISNKIKNFSHQELNVELYTNIDNINYAVENKIDLFNRGASEGIEYIKIEKNINLPKNYKLLF